METRQNRNLKKKFARIVDVQRFVNECDSPELCQVVLERALKYAKSYFGPTSTVYGTLLTFALDYHRGEGSAWVAFRLSAELRKFVLLQYRHSTLRRTVAKSS